MTFYPSMSRLLSHLLKPEAAAELIPIGNGFFLRDTLYAIYSIPGVAD
jgi:hypothetical protein